MKLLFLATRDVSTYLAGDIRAYHGNVVEVSEPRGLTLLHYYPHNFFSVPIGLTKLGMPARKSLKVSDITILTIHYWPQDVMERNLLKYLPQGIEFINLDNENNKNWTSGAKALNSGIKKAKNDVVICAHEDMVFGKDWFQRFIKQECRLKKWGILGIVGMGFDRCLHWGSNYDVPYKVASLDECCIIINRKNGLWFDATTFKGWHCYGVDLCLQAYNKGLGVYVVSGPANHGQRGYAHSDEWEDALKPNQKLLKRKWAKVFPVIVTTTGVL